MTTHHPCMMAMRRLKELGERAGCVCVGGVEVVLVNVGGLLARGAVRGLLSLAVAQSGGWELSLTLESRSR